MITRSNKLAATSVSACGVCYNEHSREHCPVCGARRVFYCSEAGALMSSAATPGDVVAILMHDVVSGRELVRAYRSDLAFSVTR